MSISMTICDPPHYRHEKNKKKADCTNSDFLIAKISL